MPDAREHFDRLAGLLVGVAGEADSIALALLAGSLTHFVHIDAMLAEQGPVTIDRDGNARRNPLSMIHSKLHDQVMTGLREFGLSPASAHRVSATAPQADGVDDDSMDAVLKLADIINPKLVGGEQ